MGTVTTNTSIRRIASVVLFVICVGSFGIFNRVFPQVNSPSPSPSPAVQPTPEILSEVDPTKPILFSVRNEYRDLKNGNWADTVLFRYDRFALRNLKIKGGGKGFVLRVDVPINTVHRGTVTKTGLGDVYTQMMFVPYANLRFAFSAGTGVSLPTATDDTLGSGKVLIAPVAVPIWYLAARKRLITLRIQNFTSIAGKRSRPDVNYFNLDPTVAWAIDRKSWVLLNTEFKRDWRLKRGSATTGVQFGRMISDHVGFWIKPEFPWGAGRTGGFNIKVGMFRFR